MALLMLLRRFKRGDVTAHGFRSAFSDWAHEETRHPNHVIEMAVAHAIESKVEAAYRCGQPFEKKRILMNYWAAYCSSSSQALSGKRVVKQSGIGRQA